MERQLFILKAIIESFIKSAEPIGSQYLLDHYELNVSSATVRNEMSALEKQGLIYQPYTSAGRIPTDHGFRVFVNELMSPVPQEVLEAKQSAVEKMQSFVEDEKVYQAVSLLSRTCGNVCFATISMERKSYYLGLSNILQEPEFQNSAEAYTVVKVFEDREHFIDLLGTLDIDQSVKIFIGEENIIKEIRSCSLIAIKFHLASGKEGIMGILGPKRMNYAYNIGALEYMRDHLR